MATLILKQGFVYRATLTDATKMSDTPETDENMVAWDRANRPGCDADFARKLERERDEARKERDEWIIVARQLNEMRQLPDYKP